MEDRKKKHLSLQHDLITAINGRDVKRFEACVVDLLAELAIDKERGDEAGVKIRERSLLDDLHRIFGMLDTSVQIEWHDSGSMPDIEIVGDQMVLALRLEAADGINTAEEALQQVAFQEYTIKHMEGDKDVWAIGAVLGERSRIEWREALLWEKV